MKEDAAPTETDLKKKLSPEQYYVCVQKGTERPFTNKYCDFEGEGRYVCVACGQELFSSKNKFHSGSGWPSFYDVLADGHVTKVRDSSHGMERIEVTCSKCGSHLGHLFDDGPKPTGQRYCINSAALEFQGESKPGKEISMPEDSLYRLKTRTLEGKEAGLGDYAGKVTLIVNVASKCGFTPQYSGLEKLHGELKGRGFAILGFPSNDFGKQEPGTPEEIREFCSTTYPVTFPLFEKVVTKAGEGQSPVYANLQKQSGELPDWNFCKYLVGKDGRVIKFFKSKVKPDSEALRKEIDAALK